MNTKKKLLEALNLANIQNNKVSAWMDELNVENDIYNKVISAYISIIIDHHKSILELTNIRQSSALCLVRPLYEAYIRVTWLCMLFGSKKVNKAIKHLIELNDNDSFPTLKVMCEELDKEFAILNKEEDQHIFVKDLDNNKKLIHSYTHGGAYLISILINRKDEFIFEDMISILKSTTYELLSSVSSYSAKIHNIDLFTKVNEQMIKLEEVIKI